MLCARAAQISGAAFAVKLPEGRWARPPECFEVADGEFADGVVAVVSVGFDYWVAAIFGVGVLVVLLVGFDRWLV